MRSLFRLAVVALAPVLVLCAEQRAAAYFPLNCNRAHAKNDFKDAALVVIGRVTAVERFRDVSPPASKTGKKEPTDYFYLATVTVGRTLKGKAKPGDEILFYTGSYPLREEDNTRSTWLHVANSHPPWTLDYDRVYLLALDSLQGSGDLRAEVRRDGKWVHAPLEKREIWEPRSCHWSVHEIVGLNRTEPGGKGPGGMETVLLVPETYVALRFDRRHDVPPEENRLLLGEFVAAQAKGEFPGEDSKEPPSAPAPQDADPAKAKPDGGPAKQTPEVKSGQPSKPRELAWYEVNSGWRTTVLRAKVPGGWFVQLRDEVGHLKSEAPPGAAFFYPDPEHKWDGSSLPR